MVTMNLHRSVLWLGHTTLHPHLTIFKPPTKTITICLLTTPVTMCNLPWDQIPGQLFPFPVDMCLYPPEVFHPRARPITKNTNLNNIIYNNNNNI